MPLFNDFLSMLDGLHKAVIAVQSLFVMLKDRLDQKALDKLLNLQKLIGDLQNQALSLQQRLLELERKNTELKEKIKQYEQWKADAESYELAEVEKGVWLYREKDTGACCCPNCFLNYRKSIVQLSEKPNTKIYHCPACGFRVEKSKQPLPTGAVARGRSRWNNI